MAYCENCNRLIVIGKTVDGKKIPLDPKASVYRIVERGDDGEGALIDRAPNMMVSHLATCPLVNRYTGVKKEREIYP